MKKIFRIIMLIVLLTGCKGLDKAIEKIQSPGAGTSYVKSEELIEKTKEMRSRSIEDGDWVFIPLIDRFGDASGKEVAVLKKDKYLFEIRKDLFIITNIEKEDFLDVLYTEKIKSYTVANAEAISKENIEHIVTGSETISETVKIHRREIEVYWKDSYKKEKSVKGYADLGKFTSTGYIGNLYNDMNKAGDKFIISVNMHLLEIPLNDFEIIEAVVINPYKYNNAKKRIIKEL